MGVRFRARYRKARITTFPNCGAASRSAHLQGRQAMTAGAAMMCQAFPPHQHTASAFPMSTTESRISLNSRDFRCGITRTEAPIHCMPHGWKFHVRCSLPEPIFDLNPAPILRWYVLYPPRCTVFLVLRFWLGSPRRCIVHTTSVPVASSCFPA
jgi:hypothetical protein